LVFDVSNIDFFLDLDRWVGPTCGNMPPGHLRLRRWRKAAGLSCAALGELLGVDRSNIAHWEAGRYRPSGVITRAALEAISDGEVPADSWLTRAERLRLRAICA
jgi:DNA-binding XRE family transcriptional regulator